jgi:hypothetical protein
MMKKGGFAISLFAYCYSQHIRLVGEMVNSINNWQLAQNHRYPQ